MYDEEWLKEVHVNEWAVINRAKQFEENPGKAWKLLESLLLLRAVSVLDVSTLFGDDTVTNVTALVNKAVQPLPKSFVQQVIGKLAKLLYEINSTFVPDCNPGDIEFIKIDNKEYKIAVHDKNDNVRINDEYVSYEDFVEVKHILKILQMDGIENVNEELVKFLVPGGAAGCKKYEGNTNLYVAAICVYPQFVTTVAKVLESKGLHINCNSGAKISQNGYNKFSKGELKKKPKKETQPEITKLKDISNDNLRVDNTLGDNIPIAAVAAGFPCGLYDLESKIREITYAVNAGASEIDIVISRNLVLGHRWLELYNEVSALKRACGNAKMKTILAVGECGCLENVYKAAMVSMMAGSYCIKTSTGKETVNATFPSGLIMCRAIRNFYMKTGKRVGFKPAGGIRTSDDAIKWLRMIILELGVDWLPLCRIGASSVLKSIEQRLKEINQ